MILILSRPDEYSTNRVSAWIDALGGHWARLNDAFLRSDKRAYAFLMDEEGIRLTVDPSLDIRDIHVVWYRKWSSSDGLAALHKLTDDKEWAISLFNHVSREVTGAGQLLFQWLEDKKWLDHPETIRRLKKNDVLAKARRHGLQVPRTLITNHRDEVLSFLTANGRVIVKPITEVTFFNNDQFEFLPFTQELTEDRVRSLQAWFLPSLFQQLIEKQYEVRTFYLDGHCDSMAIFSQEDAQTASDYRNYNTHRPNRMVPYRLPDTVAAGIDALMKEIGLTTGSVDFIVTPEGGHYFLEVNPVGQFGMTSHPCNYRLEKKIAQYLIDHDR